MPIGFLTEAEREQLNRFPEHIPEDDLSVFFLLSEADHHAVNRQHDDHTRLGFALQLCTLRYLGFVPNDLGTAPSPAVGYVAEQLRCCLRSLQLTAHVLPHGPRICNRCNVIWDFAGHAPGCVCLANLAAGAGARTRQTDLAAAVGL